MVSKQYQQRRLSRACVGRRVCDAIAGGRARSKLERTDSVELCGAEAGAAVKPVIVTQLVDLYPLPVGRRMRHLLCRHGLRLVRAHVCGQTRICMEKVWRKVEVLLEGEFCVDLGEKRERSHDCRVCRAR